MHLQGFRIDPETFWGHVYAVCAGRYDMEKVGKVYLYGDGAAWIAKGLDVFPGATHILDAFHYKQRMKRLRAGAACAPYGALLLQRVRHDDLPGFKKQVAEMQAAVAAQMTGKDRDLRLEAIRKDSGYIAAHWAAVQAMKLPDSIGSCTEPMVSHVLAERFSRNPMGWGEEGLAKMAGIRVYVRNGGTVTAADVRAGKGGGGRGPAAGMGKYDAVVKKQLDEALSGAGGWRWFEKDNLASGRLTGTKHALDLLGRTKKIG
jgi:hypothetical protein